jgi:cell division protein FtsB
LYYYHLIFFICSAIKNELIQQKQTLAKQREEYVRKKMLIARELDLLRDQEEELLEEKSRDNDRILKENNKLQVCTLYVTLL